MENFEKCIQICMSYSQQLSVKNTENISLLNCLNRVLSDDIFSPINIPSYLTSIKDGYAINCENKNLEFLIIDHIRAGDTREIEIKENECVYVTTGSPLPRGANAVIEIEQIELISNGSRIRLKEKVSPNNDVRLIGSDIKKGELVLKAGCSLQPGDLGVLASIGKGSISVYTKPKCAIFTTGDELVQPALDEDVTQLDRGKVFDCNRVMLQASVMEAGGECFDLGTVGDDFENLQKKIDSVFEMECNILITTGGVSVGERDIMRLYLERHGTILFNRVNIKPGKPTTFATIKNDTKMVLVFSLPGNPVSSLVMFNVFVTPCIRLLSGRGVNGHPTVFSRIASDVKLDPRPEFQRVKLSINQQTGEFIASTTGFQRSSRITSASQVDALICLPSSKLVQDGMLRAGTVVETLIFSDWRRTPSFYKQVASIESLAPKQVSYQNFKNLVPARKLKFSVWEITKDLKSFDLSKIRARSTFLENSLKNSELSSFKTISVQEIDRILKGSRDVSGAVIILTSANLSFTSQKVIDDKVRQQVRIFIPGLVQFLREKTNCINDITIGILRNDAVIVNLISESLDADHLLVSIWDLLVLAVEQVQKS